MEFLKEEMVLISGKLVQLVSMKVVLRIGKMVIKFFFAFRLTKYSSSHSVLHPPTSILE